MKKLLIIVIAAILALAACPTDGDSGGGSSLPKGIVMKTAKSGDVSIYLEGEDITINWGDKTALQEITGPFDNDIGHNYADATERTITITGVIYGLNCSSLELKSLDVRAAKDLKELSCYENSLTKLDVSRNTALVELYCQNNYLESLNVSRNTKLVSLWCWHNYLESLDVSRNTALEVLDCLDNGMYAAALNNLFKSLVDRKGKSEGYIYIGGNPGVAGCDQTIATGKNWVFGWY